MKKLVEMDLEFMNYIAQPPIAPKQLLQRACSNDEITITSWRETWINNYTENHKRFGPFKDNGIGEIWGANASKPAICVGSGPSLKENIDVLATVEDMMIVSCLHNFHFMVDHGVDVDYFVSLDAGKVCLEEISEGGEHDAQYYLDKTKDHTLLAFVGSDPELIEKWQGKVLWFNAPIPDTTIIKAFNDIEPFEVFIGNGGNVLGACTYIAKGVMGSNPIAFVGADFSFGYTRKFHGWDSKYDKDSMQNAVRVTDVFGNSRLTWPSYHNFKCWFDWLVCNIPGIWINCTEGGTLGAYPEGLLMHCRQMWLKDFKNMWGMHKHIERQCKTPWDAKGEGEQIKLLF